MFSVYVSIFPCTVYTRLKTSRNRQDKRKEKKKKVREEKVRKEEIEVKGKGKGRGKRKKKGEGRTPRVIRNELVIIFCPFVQLPSPSRFYVSISLISPSIVVLILFYSPWVSLAGNEKTIRESEPSFPCVLFLSLAGSDSLPSLLLLLLRPRLRLP